MLLILLIIAVLLVGFLVFSAEAWFLKVAWNTFIPAVFHGPHLDFTQALGAILFVNIIGVVFRAIVSERSN